MLDNSQKRAVSSMMRMLTGPNSLVFRAAAAQFVAAVRAAGTDGQLQPT